MKNPAPCTAGGGFKLSFPRSLGRNGRWHGRRSVLTTAPGATADTMDTRPRDVGLAADQFAADFAGGSPLASRRGVETGRPAGAADGGAGAAEGGAGGADVLAEGAGAVAGGADAVGGAADGVADGGDRAASGGDGIGAGG